MYCMLDSFGPVRMALGLFYNGQRRNKLPLPAQPVAYDAPGTNVMARIVQREACSVKRKGYKILWYCCGAVELLDGET
jgi:hypothetical protein